MSPGANYNCSSSQALSHPYQATTRKPPVQCPTLAREPRSHWVLVCFSSTGTRFLAQQITSYNTCPGFGPLFGVGHQMAGLCWHPSWPSPSPFWLFFREPQKHPAPEGQGMEPGFPSTWPAASAESTAEPSKKRGHSPRLPRSCRRARDTWPHIAPAPLQASHSQDWNSVCLRLCPGHRPAMGQPSGTRQSGEPPEKRGAASGPREAAPCLPNTAQLYRQGSDLQDTFQTKEERPAPWLNWQLLHL